MKVSIEWLREYVDVKLAPGQLADLLSMSGTEVERIEMPGSDASGVLAARITGVRPHPNADNLTLADVYDGSVERTVVCGAPNLREGMHVVLATVGAILPEISSRPLKKARIRGVESDGMLLSAAELGISDDHSGILDLGTDVLPGTDVGNVVPLKDVVLDLEITPNRPDCMSMVGIAREVAAVTGARLLPPVSSPEETGGPISERAVVRVEDAGGCPRYTARVVTGVNIGPSPVWMQRRLTAAGLRPINNVVDVTNYVLLEMGQPLHAFDLDLLVDRTIVVRRARRGEVLKTLDGAERQLDEHALVIADPGGPVALAGVIGGESSEVGEDTVNILIESACFEPTSILLTSRRLGIRTEASARFERGSDLEGTADAADRAALLMAELAGGVVARGVIDERAYVETALPIELRPERVNRVLGTTIATEDMKGILRSLGAGVSGSVPLEVTAPSFRPDLSREIDLVEEIARVYGFDRIPISIPGGGGFSAGLKRRQVLENRLAELLVSLGMSEVIAYSFMSSGDLEKMRLQGDDPLRRAVTLKNPLAETGEAMRTTLIPGLLRIANGNINRGNRDLAMFEMGRSFTYRGPGELPEEKDMLGLLLCGIASGDGWYEPGRAADYFDLKGILEDALAALGVSEFDFQSADAAYLAPGRAAILVAGGAASGLIGQLHPDVASDFGIEEDVYVGEIDVSAVVSCALEEPVYVKVDRFPGVKVDIAAVVDDSVESRLVEGVIMGSCGDLLRSVKLFDVYRGPPVPNGKKSLAYALEFGSSEGTLTDEEAHAEMERVMGSLETELGAVIRGREEVEGERA